MTDVVDPEGFYSAATDLFDLAESLSSLLGDALSELSDTGKMAGNDDRGTEFSDAYDPLVTDVESTGRDLVSALHHYGSVVRQAGINHAEAEADSDLGDGGADEPPPVPAEPLGMCYPLPASAGGSLEGLLEDIGINEHLDIPVPDGDTSKLSTAHGAWDGFHSDLSSNMVGKVAAIANRFSDLDGEDIDFIIEDLGDLDDGVTEYQSAVGELQDATSAHKEYLDEVRSQLEGLLKDLAIEIGATAVIGIAASFVTFGGGAAVAGARIATVVAKFARRISKAIRTVMGLRKAKISPGMARRLKQSKLNEDLIKIKQLEVKKATTTGARNQRKGELGEVKGGLDPSKKKERIKVNGRTRIPDDIDDVAEEVIEVKNVNNQGLTQQVKDSKQIADDQDYTLRIVVDERTKISGPLKEMQEKGDIVIEVMDLN